MKKVVTIILILIFLIGIVFISYLKLQDVKISNYYREEEKEMINASKEYFNNFQEYLPKNINDNTRVLVSALVREAYLEEALDINGKACDYEKSYVEIKKISSNEYLYEAYLVCPNADYKTKKE